MRHVHTVRYHHLLTLPYFSGLVIDQAVKGGFRFRNIEEEEVVKIAALESGAVTTGMLMVQGEGAYDTVLHGRVRDRESGSIKKDSSEEPVMIEKSD